MSHLATALAGMRFYINDLANARTQKLELLRRALLEEQDASPVLAGADLGGHRAVFVADDGKAYYADQASPDCLRCAGITTAAALLNEPLAIQNGGVLLEPSWAWVGEGAVWLGSDGLLTQVPPTTGYLVHVGTPLGPTRLRIDPYLVAKLT